MQAIHNRGASSGSATDLIKELVAVASNPQELAKNLAQLEAKIKACDEAEKKLLERQGKVEKLEAEFMPKSEAVNAAKAKLDAEKVELEKEKAEYRDKNKALSQMEKEVFNSKAQFAAEKEEYAKFLEGQKAIAANVNAEAEKAKAEAQEYLAKVKHVHEQFNYIMRGMGL